MFNHYHQVHHQIFNGSVFDCIIRIQTLMTHIIHRSTNGQPTVSNIPQSKIAVRLYLNLYTTTDGRPPTNIQINLVNMHAKMLFVQIFACINIQNICFDLQTITDLNIGAARTVMMPSHHRVPPSKFIIHTSDPTMESPFSRTLVSHIILLSR